MAWRVAVPILWLLFFGPVRGGAFEVPPLTSAVVDNARVISSPVKQALQQELETLRKQGGPQIQVLTTSSLDGLAVEQAALEVAEKWQLGQREQDNGVLLLVAPNERKVRIEVGQGLEGLLPDVIASRIIREVIVPEFRKNNFDRGIVLGVQYITQAVWPESDELHFNDLSRQTDISSPFGAYVPLLVFVLFFVIMLLQAGLRRRGFRSQGPSSYGGYGSSWGGGGSFGSSSGSGGSWSGGGGGFSGGGASGGW